MAGFFSHAFNCRVRCPEDGTEQMVEFQTTCRRGDHFLDVRFCSSFGSDTRIVCAKACRQAAATRKYWREVCSGAALYSNDR